MGRESGLVEFFHFSPHPSHHIKFNGQELSNGKLNIRNNRTSRSDLKNGFV